MVELRDVSLTLGGRTLFSHCWFTLATGEHTAVVGPNGSGKSSFLRLLAGLQWPDRSHGERRFFDPQGEVTSSPLLARRWTRLVSPEQVERFLRLRLRVTVVELIAGGMNQNDHAVFPIDTSERKRALALAGDFGLDERLDQVARTLSHGLLRRAFLARALMSQPRILFLDQALDGLDHASGQILRAQLERAAASGTTLAAVASRVADLPLGMRRCYCLRDRQLVALIPPGAAASREVALPPLQSPRLQENDPSVQRRLLVELAEVAIDRGGFRVLTGISFLIEDGVHGAIIGANGSGKSTLAGVLDGSYLPSTGRLVYFGRERRPALHELRRRIAVFSDQLQTRFDQPDPVRHVIASGRTQSIGGRITTDLQTVSDVNMLINRFALGAVADEPFSQLSFGQRRLTLLARALIDGPRLLILDEAFNGLDDETRTLLATALDSLRAAGTTLYFISHRADEIPDWVKFYVSLQSGRVVAGLREP